VHEHDWLSSPFTSAAGTAARGFCETFGLQQLVDQPTHKNAILDLVMTEYSGSVTYHPHLGSSDHIGLFVRLSVSLQVHL